MLNDEILNLIQKFNYNKKLYSVVSAINNFISNEKLQMKKEKLEFLINAQRNKINKLLIKDCNHFFVIIKNSEDQKVICPKCGLTNMYMESGIYGDSKESEMNRMFFSNIKNINDINIELELGIFSNPYYAKNLYLRALEESNLKDDKIVINKMMELKKEDLCRTLKK